MLSASIATTVNFVEEAENWRKNEMCGPKRYIHAQCMQCNSNNNKIICGRERSRAKTNRYEYVLCLSSLRNAFYVIVTWISSYITHGASVCTVLCCHNHRHRHRLVQWWSYIYPSEVYSSSHFGCKYITFTSNVHRSMAKWLYFTKVDFLSFSLSLSFLFRWI